MFNLGAAMALMSVGRNARHPANDKISIFVTFAHLYFSWGPKTDSLFQRFEM
jgi:hypothetical protein